MEGHPEEDDHGKDQAECHDASLRFLLRQFLYSSRSAVSRLFSALHMAEGATESVVDGNGEDERGTSHCKCKVIGIVYRRAKVLLRPFHNLHSSRRSKQRTDIDGHVEDGES